jgi:acetyltransferase
MAVICIPAKYVKDAISECGTAGVKSIVIITAGFSETGDSGETLEQEFLAVAKEHNIRIIGPNCLGIISTYSNLNTTFGDAMPNPGPISFVSQSGALCTSVIAYSFAEHLGFSNFVSVGNKSDVDDADLIQYFNDDPETKCIMLYIESLKDARKFFRTSQQIIRNKPVVAIKSGYTEEGAKATSSHTGSIAGSDAAYDAAFKQSGVLGENIAILTNAGGPGVLAADTAHALGMKLAPLTHNTIERLNKICPPAWSHRNPVDIIGDAPESRYTETLRVLMTAKEIDGIVLLLAPTAAAEPMKLAHWILELFNEFKKPITVSYVGMMESDAENFLDSHGIPEIEYPERAVYAMYALIERYRFLKKEGLL